MSGERHLFRNPYRVWTRAAAALLLASVAVAVVLSPAGVGPAWLASSWAPSAAPSA